MHFWKKLSIRSQITLGFLPLIIFMSLLSLNVMSGRMGSPPIQHSTKLRIG